MCWKPNLGLLQEEQVLLITEPPLSISAKTKFKPGSRTEEMIKTSKQGEMIQQSSRHSNSTCSSNTQEAKVGALLCIRGQHGLQRQILSQ